MIKKTLKYLASISGHQHVDLSETQWWTLEELQELQEFQFRKIVKSPEQIRSRAVSLKSLWPLRCLKKQLH
ncbi:hypothetical protein [Methanosarcina sp. 1.H.A.2.2]|uniref:hypothetical protein n=1 Tax=Methanosarcina sp. 1.H.A.2.2 TaxID=1483601 RepID=UPI0012DFF94E|nr:hypothetical protein [Methanosarcina sp. 1.H.A.2.2]